MLRQSADSAPETEQSRQARDADVSGPEAADHQEPVAVPPPSSRWYEESTTYQYILEEGEAIGRAKELRKMLLRQGQIRFGAPSATVKQVLESLNDLERMERMAERVLEVPSWQELLDTP